MKKPVLFILLFFLFVPFHFTYAYKSDIAVVINGVEQQFENKPFIKNGTAMVPMRNIFEALGVEVHWQTDTRLINAKGYGKRISLTVNSKTASINGRELNISEPAVIAQNSTYVPLRFVSEALGAEVHWNQNEKNISIHTIEFTANNDKLLDLINEKIGDPLEESYTADILNQTIEVYGINPIISYHIKNDQLIVNNVFHVDNQLQHYQNNENLHQRIWGYYKEMFPPTEWRVSQLTLFTDGPDNHLASVYQDVAKPGHWVLNVDIQDVKNTKSFYKTLIHEFAHILTLNDNQLEIDDEIVNIFMNKNYYIKALEKCDRNSKACGNKDSYIYQFFDQFWLDIYHEWNDLDKNNEQQQNSFYQKNKDQFVSRYAATNPIEDIAESWTNFVLGYKPTGKTIADQKVLFFYQYPELIKLRSHILKGLNAITEISS